MGWLKQGEAKPQKCNFRRDIDDYEIFGNVM